MEPTLDEMFKVYKENKYKLFTELNGRSYNLNITGWRNTKAKLDKWEDWISVGWQSGKEWRFELFRATTRPGKFWLNNLLTPRGTAILAPNQYIGAYEIGDFKGKDVLRQVRPVCVYRDKNKDNAFDMNIKTLESGLFGIHIHDAGVLPLNIGKWSAGCQVVQKGSDFDYLMRIVKESAKIWGNRFSYALVEGDYG